MEKLNKKTLEYHRGKTSDIMQIKFDQIREAILNMDDDIVEKYNGGYIAVNKRYGGKKRDKTSIGIYTLEDKIRIRMAVY